MDRCCQHARRQGLLWRVAASIECPKHKRARDLREKCGRACSAEICGAFEGYVWLAYSVGQVLRAQVVRPDTVSNPPRATTTAEVYSDPSPCMPFPTWFWRATGSREHSTGSAVRLTSWGFDPRPARPLTTTCGRVENRSSRRHVPLPKVFRACGDVEPVRRNSTSSSKTA